MTNRKQADIKLREAVARNYDVYLDRLMLEIEQEDDIVFSEEFETNMQRLIEKSKKPYYKFISTTARKVASILIIIFISLAITTMSVEALREPIFKFFIETYEKFTKVTFQPENENEEISIPTTIEQAMEPSYLPDGFEETDREKTDIGNMIRIEFTNESGDILLFSQMTMDELNLTIDTEGVDTKDMSVNENSGIFYSNNGWNTLIWNDKQYAYSIFSLEDKETILKIAESIEVKK